MTEPKAYSSVKPTFKPLFEGIEKVDLADVLNKEIVIKDFGALPSTLAEGKEFVVILADVDGKEKSFSCGEVVLRQLKDVKDSLPIKATISREKGKRYYTLK